jgi:hypothetical protein
MDKDDDRLQTTGDRWTEIERYITLLNRRRLAARRRTKVEPRTEPQIPDFALSTLPFIALAIALAVIAGSVIVLAWPGGR